MSSERVTTPNVSEQVVDVDLTPTNMEVDESETQANNGNAIPSTEGIVEPQRRQTSVVWKHFKRKIINGEWKAVCNYCDAKRLGVAKQGTSHLRSHFTIEKIGGETIVVGNYAFNQEVARRALARMVILHEYPMSIVDHIGFKDFCATLKPLFKGISRNTIKTDIMKFYDEAKENTMRLLSKNKGRIAITTDMWTATHQNKCYMTVTAHFIDDSWNLQSRLVR